MLYNWTEQFILLEYLISYICHDTLSLFVDDSDFRKIDKLEEKRIVVNLIWDHECFLNCFVSVQ